MQSGSRDTQGPAHAHPIRNPYCQPGVSGLLTMRQQQQQHHTTISGSCQFLHAPPCDARLAVTPAPAAACHSRSVPHHEQRNSCTTQAQHSIPQHATAHSVLSIHTLNPGRRPVPNAPCSHTGRVLEGQASTPLLLLLVGAFDWHYTPTTSSHVVPNLPPHNCSRSASAHLAHTTASAPRKKAGGG